MIIYDKEGNQVEVDNHVRGLFLTDHVHGMIHKGKFFSLAVEMPSLGNNAYLDLLIIPGSAMHCQMSAFSGGDAHIQWWKNPAYTIPSPNNLQTPVNHNDFSTKVADATFYQDPTVSDPGTAWRERLPVFGGTGGQAAGLQLHFNNERILSPANEYLVRLQNTSGQTNDAHILIFFYQPTV